nr:hypothetical protein [Tanacetum cinerariifolium]
MLMISMIEMIMQKLRQSKNKKKKQNGVRPDATGLPGFSVIMKCTCAIRQLAVGVTPDSLDEYLQMALIVCTGNGEIAQKDGMGNLLVVIKTGANNDLTALNNSSLFDDLLDDIAPVALFECNGVTFEKGYYLADDIYLQWSSFIKSFTAANLEKNALFKRKQKSARKDVERAFGVLQGHCHIICQPARAWTDNKLRRCVLSNLLLHGCYFIWLSAGCDDQLGFWCFQESMQRLYSYQSWEICVRRTLSFSLRGSAALQMQLLFLVAIQKMSLGRVNVGVRRMKEIDIKVMKLVGSLAVLLAVTGRLRKGKPNPCTIGFYPPMIKRDARTRKERVTTVTGELSVLAVCSLEFHRAM